MTGFGGAGVGNPVPFTDSGLVNEDEYRRHVDFMVDGGVDMLMPVPMVGNGLQLSDAERYRVIEVTVEQVAGRVGVYPMCYVPAGTKNQIDVVRRLAELGADGAYLPTPILWQCGPEAIYEHYRAIIAAAPIPVVIYNCPATTGTNVPGETVERLLDEFPGRVLGFKQHVMSQLPFDVERLARRIPLAPACFDRYTWSGLQLGCRFQVTIGGALVPEAVSGIFARWNAGDRDGAKRLFDEYRPLFDLPPLQYFEQHRDYYAGTYYHILARLGFDFGRPRLPYLWPLRGEYRRLIDEALDRLPVPAHDTKG